ncbi:hypothetical protein, partial [Escherichia coli]|uniref:hypothetical protein n=1 Tax=Escherichia coli TaxID=562 RepID=UPI004056FD61
ATGRRGIFSPATVSYCLHCKNAAISAPAIRNRNSHSEVWVIQIMSTTVVQITVVFNGFCDINACSFYGEALTFFLLKEERQASG